MTMVEPRTISMGGRRVPVVLPDRRDARLHTAAVIVTIHTIGILALGFRVSVPQIVVSILTAALIDVALTFRASGRLVWPASGMLTGSGVALILRLVGMEPGDYWTWQGWHWYAVVAGVSILTKYVIRRHGSHVFNPSNLGLVLAFLIIGDQIVEPLDFWWAPLGPFMVLAYVVIVVGGVLITRRLRLLEMVMTYYGALGAGLAVLSTSGHCMTARWSPTPVCGARFWTVLMTSPEILVFLFFMITDPRTIPEGRRARVVFAGSLGLFSTLLIAPHALEYGAKVGLLTSLVVWSPLRGFFDRLLPDRAGQATTEPAGLARLVVAAPGALFAKGALAGVGAVILAVGIVAAGAPARIPAAAAAARSIPDLGLDIDAAAVPEPVVDPSLRHLDTEIDPVSIAHNLLENLAIEAEALRTADGSLLGLADGGDRLDALQAALDEALATGVRTASLYDLESVTLRLHEAPEGQASAGIAADVEGRVTHVRYDAHAVEQDRGAEGFAATFVLRRLAGERWLIVSVETID